MESNPLTPSGWHSFKLAQLLWTHWRRACDFIEAFGHFSKHLHVVELSHISSMFWAHDIHRHQLTTVSIMEKVLEQSSPFYSWIDFFFLNERSKYTNFEKCVVYIRVVNAFKTKFWLLRTCTLELSIQNHSIHIILCTRSREKLGGKPWRGWGSPTGTATPVPPFWGPMSMYETFNESCA
jgi:hypothetical protein